MTPARPTLRLDHLVVIAPSLQDGTDHVRATLGIAMPFGGAHPEMGTHNHLLRLGDGVFLEVIAVDPEALLPSRARWFGLDDADTVRADWEGGRRLRAWVARTGDLGTLLAAHGDRLGRAARVSRGDRSWSFAVRDDGALPEGGAAPCPIDWGPRGCPAPSMPDLGARLVRFTVEHPEPGRIRDLHAALGIADPPEVVRGPAVRLRALVETPGGVRELR